MSRKVASFLHAVSNAATVTMSARQKSKTKAGLVAKINADLSGVVSTPHGDIKLLTSRSSNIAAAVAGFLTDEPETLVWIDSMSADEVFWDIGANIGLYSLYAGLRQDLVVYGFEPSALNYGLIAEHIIINDLDKHVSALCIAFGDETGLLKLYGASADVGHASNSIGTAENQFGAFDAQYEQMVPVYTIDDFCKNFNCRVPDHIKLDVDGLEAHILRGAQKTIKKIKSLLIEIEGDQARQDELLGLIAKAGLVEQEISPRTDKTRNRLFVRP